MAIEQLCVYIYTSSICRGRVEGSQMWPGDVTLHLPTHTVAVDVTILHIQAPAYWSDQSKRPCWPVMKEEEAKRKKYANIQFMDACSPAHALCHSRWTTSAILEMRDGRYWISSQHTEP